MNEIKIFSYEENEVRTVEENGEVWWVLKYVCDVLEISNTSQTTSRLDEDELMYIKHISGGQEREMICVNESGLYRLILCSDKPNAKSYLARIIP